MDPYIGEIRPFAFGSFAPGGWLTCSGQTLPIQQYPALAAIVGGQYGTMTSTTFTLPNLTGTTYLNSTVLVGQGQLTYPGGATGQIYDVGDTGGTMTVPLYNPNMPLHTHTVNQAFASNYATAETTLPTGNSLLSNVIEKGTANVVGKVNVPSSTPLNTSLSPVTISVVGGGSPHANTQPYVAISYCICWDGVWPEKP